MNKSSALLLLFGRLADNVAGFARLCACLLLLLCTWFLVLGSWLIICFKIPLIIAFTSLAYSLRRVLTDSVNKKQQQATTAIGMVDLSSSLLNILLS